MKKLTIISLALCSVLATAQNDIDTRLKNLAPPSSPAFTLMDISPTSVYIPESLKAMSLQVLNGFGGGSDDGLPKNFAAEIVPFWYTKPKDMNLLKYYNFRKSDASNNSIDAYDSQNIFGDIFKKASISFAYMDGTFEVFDTPQNFISVGARTTLISVKKKQDIKNVVSGYKQYDNFMKTDLDVITIMGNTDPSQISDELKKLPGWQAAYDALDTAINVQPIFLVDLSVAYSAFLKSDNLGFSDHFGRFGVWLSSDLALPFSNNPNNFIHVYAVGRYLEDGLNIDSENTLFITKVYDFGGKLELEFDALSVGYEYLSREGDVDAYRSIGTIRYKISNAFTLTGGFGKNFNSGDDTVSLLGVKWGLDTGEGAFPIVQ